jgi:hypothetical protein
VGAKLRGECECPPVLNFQTTGLGT